MAHEFDLIKNGGHGRAGISILGSGGSRTSYLLSTNDIASRHQIVMKGPHFQKDAIILEKASYSPYIPDIYTFCGSDIFMEYGEGGNLYDYLRGSRFNRSTDNATFSILEKLKVGHQIASGVAALHALGGQSQRPPFAHNDICC